MRKIMIFLTALVFMFPFYSAGEDEVVIAVASDGKNLEDPVSQIAARCPYFLFFDSAGNLMEAVENPYKETRGGAGVSAADFLADRDVTIVIAGNFGFKMRDALEAHEITYVEFEGIVEEAVMKVLEEGSRR